MAGEDKILSSPLPAAVDSMSAAEVVFLSLKKHSYTSTAILEAIPERELSYGELSQQCLSAVQGLIKAGVGKNDVVAIVTYNSQESYTMFLAAIILGAIPAIISQGLLPEEMAALIEIVSPTLIFTEGGSTLNKVETAMTLLDIKPFLVVSGENHPHASFSSLLQPIDPEFRPPVSNFDEHVAVILFTSGTSGLPKAVKSLLQPIDPEFRPPVSNIDEHVAVILFTSGTSGLPKAVKVPDKYLIVNALNLCPNPELFVIPTVLFWVIGPLLLITCVIKGYKMLIFREYPQIKDIFRTVQNYKIGVWMLSTYTLIEMLAFPNRDEYDLSSVEWAVTAGSGMNAELHQRAQKELFGDKLTLTQGYGMTEVGIIGYGEPYPGYNKFGSVGRLRRGVNLKILDLAKGVSLGAKEEGEICLKGDTFMLGYWNNPSATSACFDENGWFHTGDVGYYDEDGFLFVVDRINDLIRYKFFYVVPGEIEAVLRAHPDVKDAAVVGIGHKEDRERVTAFVVATKNVEEKDLLDYVAERLPDNKQIRGGIKFVEFIPRTTTGKPKKELLKAQLGY